MTHNVSTSNEQLIQLQCSQKSFSIGRNANCDIQLSHPTVSGYHAELQILHSAGQKPCLFLKDNKSKYGVYVEGHKVPATFVSVHSDIQISVFKLMVDLQDQVVQVRIVQTEAQFTLECHKVSYFAGKKRLVNNIDLVIRPGEFVGLFGPSGSGKTSLMRLLTGYYKPNSGFIAVGGLDYQQHFDLLKNFIAYVPQEDILHPTLTVRESLEYAAKLRLPEDVSESQLKSYIDETICQLDLSKVQNQEVATLSGGQKKRVNIGTELITKPQILIADEPDAGLDPHIQDQMMEVFRQQAASGNAVIMTTHTLDNFFRFDHVAIVSKGSLCFYGPPKDALRFFCQGGPESPVEIFRRLNSEAESSIGKENYHSKYMDSSCYNQYFTKRVSGKNHWAATEDGIARKTVHLLMGLLKSFNWNTLRQFLILAHRHLLIRVGSMRSVLIYLLIPVVIAFVLAAQKVKGSEELLALEENQLALRDILEKKGGTTSTTLEGVQRPTYKQTAGSIPNPGYAHRADAETKPLVLSASQQRMLLTPKFPHVVPLTMVLAAIFCGTFIACFEISHERQIFVREHQLSVGISSYLLSKFPFLFGITFIQMSLLMGIVTFFHEIETIAFNQCVLILTLTSWASVAVGLFLSTIDKTGRHSTILSIGVIVPQIVFSGAIGPDFYSGMNRFAKLVSDLCISRWGFEGILRTMNASTVISWGPSLVDHQVGFPQTTSFHDIDHFMVYSVLGGFIVVFVFLSGISLKLQEN